MLVLAQQHVRIDEEPPPQPARHHRVAALKRHTSNIPYSPAPGSQNARLISAGVRGKLSGGYALPAFEQHDRQTSLGEPVRAHRAAESGADDHGVDMLGGGRGPRGSPAPSQAACLFRNWSNPREHVGVGILADDRIEMAVTRG